MDQILQAQVRQAAADLVAAFASNDTSRYFDCFSQDASFLFHTLPQPLLSRRARRCQAGKTTAPARARDTCAGSQSNWASAARP